MQAVAQSQAEREALKQQKKQEAAERKRLHAEAVARRKQTDIIFLGRGVSRGLADRRANVEKLAAAGLPVLATPADVAAAMGISIPRLRWLAFHNEAATRTHYVRFTVPKKSGGTRELAAPHRDLRRCQEWILRQHPRQAAGPRRRARLRPRAEHGDQRRRSRRPRGGRQHRPEGFLPLDHVSAGDGHVPRHGLFAGRRHDPGPALHGIARGGRSSMPGRPITWRPARGHCRRAPAPVPALSNRAARKLDARLAGLAGKLGWTYTRYADDATFSASGEAAESVGYLLARVRHISQDEGFAVNEKKTRVLRRNAAQLVTGIVVNQRPGVPRKLVRRLRAILHRAKTEGLAAQNRHSHPHFEAWLSGMIAYVAMVNPDQGRRLRTTLAALVERDQRGKA